MLSYGSTEKEDTEENLPVVEILSPLPCDTLYFGETFLYQVHISDPAGLGNISMDIHYNFGHHSHGDHQTCDMDPKKDAVDPYSDDWIFSLPNDETDFLFDTLLSVPLQINDTTLYDTGDYHFHIYISDNDGYQVFNTMDVKVLYQ